VTDVGVPMLIWIGGAMLIAIMAAVIFWAVMHNRKG
jgi:acyl CoA:acetate/3-ketoacid CoA transferase beta subunit